MEWSNLYDTDNQPSFEKISAYINNELWQNLNSFLQNSYQIQPKLTYSQCSMQRGWNVKYHKGGKSLCTLYPMDNSFIALVVIGNKEMQEAEFLMPQCCKCIQELYQKTDYNVGGRWLMINVTDRQILEDVINLIQIRVRPKEI